MAFNPSTDEMFPNITVDGGAGTMTLLLSDFLQQLEVSEVDPTSGTSDWRELVFSFLDHVILKFNALDVTDRPTKLQMSKSGRLDDNNEMVYTYNIQISTTVTNQNVADEPV
jgi:hypothetical protein